MASQPQAQPSCHSSCYLPPYWDRILYSHTRNMAPAEPNALPFQTKGQEPHFPEEIDGWKGYIEWEKYPEKKKEAEAILAQYDFPDVSSRLLADLASLAVGM